MKLKLMILAVILMSAECFASDACPEFVSLTILNREVTGFNCESARTPVVSTQMQGDTFVVDIQTEFRGRGTLDFTIPKEAEKIRLFDCDLDLPPPDWTAYFRSILLFNEQSPWYRFNKSETQRAMTLIAFSPDAKSFAGQTYYRGNSGSEIWKNVFNFSCLIAPDGQIFNSPTGTLRDGSSAKPFSISYEFKNLNGELFGCFHARGKYYKYLCRKNESLRLPVKLPLPKPELLTLFKLNRVAMEKYIADSRTENFSVRKNLTEFKNFAQKLNLLKHGMTQDEVAAVLGKPDAIGMSGTKGPDTAEYTYSMYFFLRMLPDSINEKDLYLGLYFERDASGNYNLAKVF